jgi:two-component system chemotaxis sensor kinase CheA
MTYNGNQQVDPETQEMLRSFVSEAFDSLDTNEPIVEFLRDESNSDHVNAIFRVFHTLKGLSGFFEMHVINKVTHEAETLLDIIRKQNTPQTEDTITVIYQTFDFLRDLLQRVNTDYTDVSAAPESEDMILIIKDAIDKVKNPAPDLDFFYNFDEPPAAPSISSESRSEPSGVQEDEIAMTTDVEQPSQFTEETIDEATALTEAALEEPKADDFDLGSLISDDMLDQYLSSASDLLDTTEKNLVDLEKDSSNTTLVAETFGAVHSLKGNSGFMGFSEIEEISMEMETILDCIRNKSLDIDSNIVTILLSNTEVIRNRLGAIQEKTHGKGEANAEAKHTPTHDVVAKAPEAPPTPTTREAPQAKPQPVETAKAPAPPAPAPIQQSQPAPAPPQTAAAKTTAPAAPTVATKRPTMAQGGNMPYQQKKDIRVDTSKIDKLFDLVGELITIETMVTNNQDIIGLDLPNFSKSANMLNKITRELQEISMSIRMMPLDGAFNKMKRLVRDVSLKMNKKVELVVFGQQTEMDKNVIDEISDPLVHILRNSIDHGVESPEERIAKGKPEVGNVTLGARYEGNEILIIVDDDGAGINREAVLKKAEEKGILKVPGEQMSDREVFALIFEPGFSTAKEITDISGRGVGMDVVRKNIEKLRGSIDIASVWGKGTKMTLRIPLTLAIMEAMVIKIGSDLYALPILSLRESFRPQEGMINVTMDGLEVVKVRDEILPIIRLHETFQIESGRTNLDDGILLLIESKERKVCLFADDIVGQQQAVIKGLSSYIGKVPGITGCMVTGDGSIGLILDIESLIDLAQTNDYQTK